MWVTKQLLSKLTLTVGKTVDKQLFDCSPSAKLRLCLADEGSSGLKQFLNIWIWMYKNKTLAYLIIGWISYLMLIKHKTQIEKSKIEHYIFF